MQQSVVRQGARERRVPWNASNTVLLFAFVASLLLAPWGYALVPLAAAGVALAGTLSVGREALAALDREDGLWLLVLLGYAGLWLWDVSRTGVWPVGEGYRGVLLPLWPLLAAGLLVWLRLKPPSRMGWWLGLVVAGIGVGLIALYERFVLGAYRADNGMNAIPFGNLSLLVGFLALAAMLGRLSRPPPRSSPWLTLALGLAAVAGLAASLLSGTRGGWVAVPLLAWLGYRAFRVVFPRRQIRIVAGLSVLLLAGLVAMTAITGYGVSDRVAKAVDDVEDYFLEGDTGSSVGLRLEMWQAGAWLFIEKPLLGWGEGRLEAARDDLVAQGRLNPGVSEYDQLHSDIIDTAARRGLVGVATLLALYGVPAWLFAGYLRRCRDAQGRTLALSGLMISVAFVDFGVTQSMLRDVRGLSGYLGLSVACWVLLRARLDVLRRRSRSRTRGKEPQGT
ncbi:O-antigen ligase family protein [Halomonas cerina]|uniref:O-antigen ligase n=1 Tax=Halomonas cerina TaxID=447424 RepID=A0A839V7Y0_9GAMM|nr:O-antigen ligase family protein [Halomonas cerina]MBB3188804.1 O-antigen ligase [Halomonas cerina]